MKENLMKKLLDSPRAFGTTLNIALAIVVSGVSISLLNAFSAIA
jgi:hypothetical protein